MMKFHRSSRLRMLGGAAAVTILGGIGLALGSPGFAAQQSAEAPKQDEARPREERVIIRTHRIGEGERSEHAKHAGHDRRVIVRTHRGDGERRHAEHGDHHVRVFNMHRGHGDHMAMADCDEGQRSEVNEGEGNERTRVVLCTRGGNATPAQRAERLQGVRDRLAQDSELSAEQRARVSAAIDREIARLRGQ